MNQAIWLELQGLGLTEHGKRIIDAVSLKVGAGRTAILGANGAGKSTLLRLIHGLLKASEGIVRWPQPLTQGMVFQRPIMLRRTVLQNVIYGLRIAGVNTAECHDRAREALQRVGLLELAARPARRISVGEQQRVALARAWALQPQVLFLDEPTASLDPASTRAVERVILDIAATGTRILMATHNLGQARRIAEDVIFLDNGRLLAHCPTAEFFSGQQHPAVNTYLREEMP